jgi:hypothetical protein
MDTSFHPFTSKLQHGGMRRMAPSLQTYETIGQVRMPCNRREIKSVWSQMTVGNEFGPFFNFDGQKCPSAAFFVTSIASNLT